MSLRFEGSSAIKRAVPDKIGNRDTDANSSCLTKEPKPTIPRKIKTPAKHNTHSSTLIFFNKSIIYEFDEISI